MSERTLEEHAAILREFVQSYVGEPIRERALDAIDRLLAAAVSVGGPEGEKE